MKRLQKQHESPSQSRALARLAEAASAASCDKICGFLSFPFEDTSIAVHLRVADLLFGTHMRSLMTLR